MDKVLGIAGYARVVDAFITASRALDFAVVNAPYLSFLPKASGQVLDVGAGAGQNAAALARVGHQVVAIEPMDEFRAAARQAYPDLTITWIDDILPHLAKLDAATTPFDIILLQAVWHHLDTGERAMAMARLADLLADGGVCAISLRHGPAGVGHHVFPTDGQQTAELAEACGLAVVLHLADCASVMANKSDVRWTHMAFRK